MGRGLDGYLISVALALCSFEGPRGAVSMNFRWLWRGGNTSSLSEQSR